MELAQQKYNDSVLYQRKVYENYLKHAGRCIYFSDHDALKDYGEYYYSALMYDLQSDMAKANSLMLEDKYDDVSPIIETIAAKIHAIQQKE